MHKDIRGQWAPTVDANQILGFFGDYRFLSNFWIAQVRFDGLCYPSAENAYQAAKCLNEADKKVFTLPNVSPGKAKQLGQKVVRRPNFDNERLNIMREVSLAKYEDPLLRAWLLNTGNRYLEETNYWNDTFWGKCSGHGDNNLGVIIMGVREDLRDMYH